MCLPKKNRIIFMLDPNESLLGKISDMTQDQFNISLLKSIKIRIYKLDEFPTQSKFPPLP